MTIRRKRLFIILSAIAILFLGSIAFASAAETEILVLSDGKYVIFEDAKPQVVNGRTVLPFRTILETFDAVIDYDHETKVLSATRGETTISFKLGDTTLSIEKGGETRTTEMDFAPYIDEASGSTMVPARFMAESFDLAVGWDHLNRTIVIIDYDELLKVEEESFSIVSRLYELMPSLETEAVANSGTFEGSLKFTDSNKPEIQFTGSVSGISEGNDKDYNLKSTLKVKGNTRGIDQVAADYFKNRELSLQLIGDGSENQAYLGGNFFDELYGNRSFVAFDSDEIFGGHSLTIEQILQDISALDGVIEGALEKRNDPNIFTHMNVVDPYAKADVYSDKNFTVTGTEGNQTFTATVPINDVDGILTLREKNGTIDSCEIQINTELIAGKVDYKITTSLTKTTGDMTVAYSDIQLVLNYEMKQTESKRGPTNSLPANANILSLKDL